MTSYTLHHGDCLEVMRTIPAAPFNSDLARVRVVHRSLVVHGQTLGARPSSLTWHLAQRTILEQQWDISTTPHAPWSINKVPV